MNRCQHCCMPAQPTARDFAVADLYLPVSPVLLFHLDEKARRNGLHILHYLSALTGDLLR